MLGFQVSHCFGPYQVTLQLTILKIMWVSKSEILNLGFDKGSEVAKVMLSDDGWYVPIVQALTSVCWISTMTSLFSLVGNYCNLYSALTVTLLPVLIVQLQKLERMAQLFPQYEYF